MTMMTDDDELARGPDGGSLAWPGWREMHDRWAMMTTTTTTGGDTTRMNLSVLAWPRRGRVGRGRLGRF